jgi:hypothetical protein
MTLDEPLRRRLERRLGVPWRFKSAPSLPEDARRLLQRVRIFAASSWSPGPIDDPAMELACLALQLPLAGGAERTAPENPGRFALVQRASRAAELLSQTLAEETDQGRAKDPQESDHGSLAARASAKRRTAARLGRSQPLRISLRPSGEGASVVDRAFRLLADLAQKRPTTDAARLLADAVNLDDFGAMGLARQALEMGRRGQSVLALLEGARQREQYAYWQARLKDGFHFAPVRDLARRRLDHYRKAAAMIEKELQEDGAG